MSEVGLRRIQSRCQQSCVPSGGSGREFLSLPVPAFIGYPLSLACGHLQTVSTLQPLLPLSHLLSLSYLPLSLIRTLLITLGPPE